MLISGCVKYHDLSTTVLKEDHQCGVIVPDAIKPDYRLYAKDGRLARFMTETQRGLGSNLYVKGKVYWQAYEQGNKTRKYRPYDIVRKCQKYTQNQDAQKLTFGEYIQLVKDKGVFRCSIQYIAFIKNLSGTQKKLYRSYKGLGDFKAAYEKGVIFAERIGKKYQIICVDPIVIVELDTDHIAWNRIFSVSMKTMWARRGDGKFYIYDQEKGYTHPRFDDVGNIGNTMILPYGLDYGLEMPYIKNPRWFSPDMKVKDQAVEMVSGTMGRIEVPWGYLYLTKQNDNWTVTAEKK
jgi:hypothetical protein